MRDVNLRNKNIYNLLNCSKLSKVLLGLFVSLLLLNPNESGAQDYCDLEFASYTVVKPDYINFSGGYCHSALASWSIHMRSEASKYEVDFVRWPTYADFQISDPVYAASITSYDNNSDGKLRRDLGPELAKFFNKYSIGPIFWGCSVTSCTLVPEFTLLTAEGVWIYDNALQWQQDKWVTVKVSHDWAEALPNDFIRFKRLAASASDATITGLGRVVKARGSKPVARAGTDIVTTDNKDAVPGLTLSLDASASTDDSGIVIYSWSGSNGSTYSGVKPSVNAPLGITEYTVTVMNADGELSRDSMSVTILQAANTAPIADAGPDQTIQDDEVPGALVQLDGSNSVDDFNKISYSWEGSDGTRYYEKSPIVSAPVGTTYYTLSVVDDEGQRSTDIVIITVNPLEAEDEGDSYLSDIPQQSMGNIITSNGEITNASITIGASSNKGVSGKTTFSNLDEIDVVTKIFPQEKDIGKEAELYVVLRLINDEKRVFYSLSSDGLWSLWDLRLKTLEPVKTVDSLQQEEILKIYSGTMREGVKSFYVGYSVNDDESGKPVIHFNSRRYTIEVLLERI